jgi:hypothetical protein
MPRSWAVSGWKDPWSEEGCDNFGWTLWGRNIGRIWGFLNLVQGPWSGIDRGSRSHELLLSDPHLISSISLYRIHNVICFKDAKITPSSTIDFPDVWDFRWFQQFHFQQFFKKNKEFQLNVAISQQFCCWFPHFSQDFHGKSPWPAQADPLRLPAPIRWRGGGLGGLVHEMAGGHRVLSRARGPRELEEFDGDFMDRGNIEINCRYID